MRFSLKAESSNFNPKSLLKTDKLSSIKSFISFSCTSLFFSILLKLIRKYCPKSLISSSEKQTSILFLISTLNSFTISSKKSLESYSILLIFSV